MRLTHSSSVDLFSFDLVEQKHSIDWVHGLGNIPILTLQCWELLQ